MFIQRLLIDFHSIPNDRISIGHFILMQVFIKVTSVTFGTQKYFSNSKFFISLYNPATGKQSKLYNFTFEKRNDLKVKFVLDVEQKETQKFFLIVHKDKFFNIQEIGKLEVPLNAFPEDAVCHERQMCQMQANDQQETPICISFDVHLNTNNAAPYSAPTGQSKLELVEGITFQNYEGKRKLTKNNYNSSSTEELLLSDV